MTSSIPVSGFSADLASATNDKARLDIAARNQKIAGKIDEKSKEFEAVFLHQMLEHMFEGLETDGVFGGGQAEQVYRSFMLDEYSKVITASGGVGVADYVKREMIAMQEKGA